MLVNIRRVPFIPSSWENIQTIVELANPKLSEKIADLGSGDGRIVVEFARRGFEAHGYEIDEDLIIESEAKILNQGLDDLAFIHWKSYWEEDLSPYDIITIYGMSSIMGKLEEKLRNELVKGSRVVSNIFLFPNWKPKSEKNNAYLYVVE